MTLGVGRRKGTGYLTQLEVQQRDSEQRSFKEPGFAAFGKNVQVSMFPCVEAGGGD